MSMSIEPRTKHACISNLISGYACNHMTDEFFVRNRIIAGANLEENQDPFSPGSEYDDADFDDITLADLRHGYELFQSAATSLILIRQNPISFGRRVSESSVLKSAATGRTN
jgi:hypothetical protein